MIICEMMKLKRSKIVFMSIVGAFAVPFMMLIEAFQTHMEYPEREFTLSDVYDNGMLYMVLMMNMLICIAIISFVFSREYAEQTLKTILPIPISRGALLAAKFVVCIILTILINFVSWIGMFALLGIYHIVNGLSGYGIEQACEWMVPYIFSGILMLLSVTPIAYLAMKTKGFVAPMVVSAALVMGTAAIINQNWAAIYPWTIPYLLAKGIIEEKGYPMIVSVGVLMTVALIGIGITFYHFYYEDLQ